MVDKMLRCVSCTPLGSPVVPELHIISDTSVAVLAVIGTISALDIFLLSINSVKLKAFALAVFEPNKTMFCINLLFLATLTTRSMVNSDANIILGLDKLMP